MAAVAAAQAQEAVGQDAALQERVELIVHKLRQVGSGSGLSLREDGRGVLSHRFVYLTEDDDASRLYSFLPRAWGDLFCPAGSRRRQ